MCIKLKTDKPEDMKLKTGIEGQVSYFNFEPTVLNDLLLDGILTAVTSSKEALKFFHDKVIEEATSLTEDSNIPNWGEIRDNALYWDNNKASIIEKHIIWLREHNQLKE